MHSSFVMSLLHKSVVKYSRVLIYFSFQTVRFCINELGFETKHFWKWFKCQILNFLSLDFKVFLLEILVSHSMKITKLSTLTKSGRYCNIIFLRRNFTQWCEMVWSRIAARHRSKYVRDWDMLSLFPIEAWIIYHLWYPFQKKYLMTSGSILASIRASQPTMSPRLPPMLLRPARYTSIEWVRHLPFSRSNQASPRKLAARMPRKHSEFRK